MKILEKDGNYRKVSNDWIADNLVKTMGWKYSSRADWKTNVRDVKKQTTLEQTKESGKFFKEIVRTTGSAPAVEEKTKKVKRKK